MFSEDHETPTNVSLFTIVFVAIRSRIVFFFIVDRMLMYNTIPLLQYTLQRFTNYALLFTPEFDVPEVSTFLFPLKTESHDGESPSFDSFHGEIGTCDGRLVLGGLVIAIGNHQHPSAIIPSFHRRQDANVQHGDPLVRPGHAPLQLRGDGPVCLLPIQ